MTEVEEAIDDPQPGDGETRADARMAEILAGDECDLGRARTELRGSGDDDASDLISRLDALDFVDTVCGQPGSELPERLGEYRVTALLGRGGMGTVYEAFQESLERPVALKVLAPSLTSDPKMRRRFRTEARANATLHHQHIVPVYGFGEAAGHLYFTMERVDGVSLDKHIASARLAETLPDPRGVARRFAGVADALAHAHRRGILHRDVKPGNILVHPDGSLALADFGLSKMLGEQSMSVSAPGGFLGTLHYAAPEQARGVEFCPASDLYSLGVTMFEALTNQLPLSGKTTEAMLEAVLRGTPKRLRSMRPKAPKDFDAVLHKLLQKDPEDRYVDAAALARDLLRVADDEPVKIRRHSPFVRTWRSMRKHPGLSSAIAIASVLLLVVLWQWRVAALARADALVSKYRGLITAAAIEAGQDAGEAAGPDGLFAVLTGLDGPTGPRASEVFRLLEEAAEIAPEGAVEPERIRTAFTSDPSPAATRALADGRGVPAVRDLDRRVEDLERQWGFASGDPVTPMQLYRLYIARAVAHLTAAACSPDQAERDLLRASLIRRGAFFPRVLTTLIEWRPADGIEPLFAGLDEQIAEGPEGARRAVGGLLIAFARIDERPGANLMDFGLEYRFRRALYERGRELWGSEPVVTSARPGLEAKLRQIARDAYAFSSAPPRRDARIDEGRELLASEVDPDSPLQAWGIVYDLVKSPDRFVPGAASDELQVSALREYLGLGPDQVVVERLWLGARDWLTSLPRTSIGACRLRAVFLEAVSPGAEALAAADEWVRADPEDPHAYLCRMRARVHEGVTAAANDAGIALQKAVDREGMRREIVAALARIEQRHPTFQELKKAFEAGSQ